MKLSLKKRDVDMLNGPILKGLLVLSLPVILMNVLASLFNMIDMAVLRNFAANPDLAVGAIGATGFLPALSTSLVNGVAVGASVIVARNLGRQDTEGVKRAVGTAMAFVMAGGFSLMVLGILFAEQLLIWTDCDAALLPGATMYFQFSFSTVPLALFSTFGAALLRAKGDTRTQMIISIVTSVVKLIFSIIAIALLDMGLMGLSLATAVTWLVSAYLYAREMWKPESPIYIEKEYVRFYATELKGMLHIGIPTGMQTALYSIANVVIQTAVNGFGKDATAGLGIANIYDGLIYNVSVGAAAAVMPYMSQNIGAGNIARAKKAMGRGVLIAVLFGGGLGALFAIFSGSLSALMSENPQVIAFSQQKMIIVSSCYFFCGINEIMCAASRSMKKPIMPTVATLTFMCGLRFLWVYAIFPHIPNNLTFLYLVWPVGWILSILVLLPYNIYHLKKLEKEHSLL